MLDMITEEETASADIGMAWPGPLRRQPCSKEDTLPSTKMAARGREPRSAQDGRRAATHRINVPTTKMAARPAEWAEVKGGGSSALTQNGAAKPAGRDGAAGVGAGRRGRGRGGGAPGGGAEVARSLLQLVVISCGGSLLRRQGSAAAGRGAAAAAAAAAGGEERRRRRRREAPAAAPSTTRRAAAEDQSRPGSPAAGAPPARPEPWVRVALPLCRRRPPPEAASPRPAPGWFT
ncbi:translation initiation factor IF-2-like [Oxyura jamaicensis]|uniref:translation initiation factor IF-2-like n=1 Tax=Oxyura jamaicensis TaxID=8884 RepID=UPI0015A6DE68|nr:translation initiation factor IF-2-like [Oxyura jamaicensis]